MQYSVIYSVDIPRGVNMRPFVPPHCRQLWDETEDDNNYEYGYLEGRWEKGHHRKWVAILDQDQFEEFLFHTGLFPENVETMGSLGAPGFGLGWSPAISFRNDDDDAIRSAYVTPADTKSELVRFLEQNDAGIPSLLLDGDGQQFLWEGAADEEAPWRAIRQAVITRYS